MHQENKSWFLRGLRDGVPIMLGYLAVSFTLGIAARNAGLTAFQAALTSLLNNASAGEYAGFTVIREDAGYVEMAIMIFVANARYLLMSCALSQKLSPKTGLVPRMIVGFDIVDEVFGVSMAVPGYLNPWYTYGMMSLAIPGWTLGTGLGVVMGNALPAGVTSALSVGLFGMFVAIIIPPARKSRVIAGIVVISMAASYALFKLPPFSSWSSGMRVILLTVVISGAAATLFPVKEEDHAA
ncbi:MAG: AzlC family ABC transporter permease [Clostridia bacterium]|nr:AzlC family ABC transporter permease [Clostridia bacterium]